MKRPLLLSKRFRSETQPDSQYQSQSPIESGPRVCSGSQRVGLFPVEVDGWATGAKICVGLSHEVRVARPHVVALVSEVPEGLWADGALSGM